MQFQSSDSYTVDKRYRNMGNATDDGTALSFLKNYEKSMGKRIRSDNRPNLESELRTEDRFIFPEGTYRNMFTAK